MALDLIKEHLAKGYQYVIVPMSMLDLPIEQPKLLKDDGVSYYSINDLREIFSDDFDILEVFFGDHIAMQWSFDEDGEDKEDFIVYMELNGLVNIRQKGDKISEMTFDSVPANGFMVCSLREMKYIPSMTYAWL